MTKIIAILECPDCGGWRDVPYADLAKNSEIIIWECFGCGFWRRAKLDSGYCRAVAIPDPADAGFYDLWLAGMPRYFEAGRGRLPAVAAVDVRPVLEPLL